MKVEAHSTIAIPVDPRAVLLCFAAVPAPVTR